MKKKVLVISIIVVLFLSIFFILSHNQDNDDTSVFFFKTDDEKYLLYDEYGKLLSDIEYDNVLDYIISSTLVYKDSKVSILDKKGNTLVSADDYDEIVRYASFYKANKNDKVYLLDNNGKIIKEITDSNIVSYKGAEKYIIVENSDNYEIILYNGKEIYTFKRDNDILPTVNQLDNLASIFYNNITIIFDVDNGNVINKIDANIHYCINERKNDLIVLNSCTNSYQDKIDYKIIKKREILDIDKTCDTLNINGTNILCKSKKKEYLLNEKLEKSLEITSFIDYIDDKNYIKEIDGKVEFYKDNKKVSTVDNATLTTVGYQEDEYYILNIEELYYYYDISGNKVIDKGFTKANLFDKNNLALVSLNDKEFLIDRKGDKKSDELDNIVVYSDFYIISNEFLGILDRKGKQVLNTEYDSINLVSKEDHNYAVLKHNKEYFMYDIDNKKIIGKYNNEIEASNFYYKVDKNYYTYNGKKIYEGK